MALLFLAVQPTVTQAEIPGTAEGCITTTNPSGYTIVSCERQGLDRNGRLLGCRYGADTHFAQEAIGCRHKEELVGRPYLGLRVSCKIHTP